MARRKLLNFPIIAFQRAHLHTLNDQLSINTYEVAFWVWILNNQSLDYIEKHNIGDKFQYSTTVDNVVYNQQENNFNVTTTHNKEQSSSIFDYVVVATGRFSWPHEPTFKGEETFTGQVIHAHG